MVLLFHDVCFLNCLVVLVIPFVLEIPSSSVCGCGLFSPYLALGGSEKGCSRCEQVSIPLGVCSPWEHFLFSPKCSLSPSELVCKSRCFIMEELGKGLPRLAGLPNAALQLRPLKKTQESYLCPFVIWRLWCWASSHHCICIAAFHWDILRLSFSAFRLALPPPPPLPDLQKLPSILID